MATFTWTLQGGTPTTIGPTDVVRFAGAAGFSARIQVGDYNETTHVRNSGGTDISTGNTPNNVLFISQAGGTGGDSQADWGGGTEDLDQITNGEATFNVEFADAASISTEDAIFYAYDGITPATAPVDVDIRVAEVGDTNFTQAEGSGSALALADQATPATSHDFYIPASVSPLSVGTKTGAFRIELSYY